MKKIYAFIIALFAFSSTMWAQVAKVSTTDKAENSILRITGDAPGSGYYADENECWAACSTTEGVYTSVFIVGKADITIPAGKYVNICRYESGSNKVSGEFTVTNNGNVRIAAPGWSLGGKFVNNGMMEITGGSTLKLGNGSSKAFHIDNNSLGTLSLLGEEAKYYSYFTLTNNGGKVSVKGGEFQTEQAYNQIKDYIADGYVGNKVGYKWSVVEATVMVNGTPYGLYAGLVASSQQYPAVLMCNLVYKSILITWDAYLDLNGHTLTFDADLDNTKQELVKLGANGKGGSLTVSGTGTIKGSNCHILFSMSGSATDTEDVVSAITIGKDVTIEQDEPYYYAIAAIDNANPYGIVVNYDGKFRGLCPFYINGTLTKTEGKVPEFNIGKTAELECGDGFAYAAGYGIWNYEGTATTGVVGIEVRAGKFTMNGGSITCTADKPADDQFNGNGSTSEACAIAASQHSTKLPIEVVVNGGELKAYTPIYQANPQKNPQEAIDKVSVVVNDAKVYSTSKNIVWSANKKVVLNGGVYNLAPTAYAAAGKTVVTNTDAATKDMYPYTIGTIASDNTLTTAGEWSTASNWSAGAVASADVPVKIAADVTISAGTKAEAYGITVESGKKITIKEGGVLMVGKDGIDGIDGITDASQLFIEDGGALLISPVAEASKSQPQSTNEIKTTIREVKDEYNNGDATYQYIWKNIAVPVQKEDMKFTPGGQSAVNVWDNDWKHISSAAEFGIPFRGYHITVHPTVEATVANPTYTFTGQLNGNDDVTLTMNREGFHLFGNSWSAPLDVRELLNQIEHFTDSKVNTGVKVYISDKCTLGGKTYFDGQYVDITRDALSSDKSFADAFSLLGAHECFFLCSNASSSQVTLNYEKAVWNAMSASAKSSAPRRMVSSDTDEPTYSMGVWIELEASNGRNDVVRLFDSDKESSKKLMSEGSANVNIYAVTPSGEYSSFYASDLTDTELAISTNQCVSYTLSFRNVKGEPLYIKDIQTGVVTEMSEGNTYTFTAEPSTTSTRFRVVSRSEVTTDVDAVVPVAGKSGVYSLMGQYLGETSVWETLPAGVYIVNGTKVVK